MPLLLDEWPRASRDEDEGTVKWTEPSIRGTPVQSVVTLTVNDLNASLIDLIDLINTTLLCVCVFFTEIINVKPEDLNNALCADKALGGLALALAKTLERVPFF